MKCVFGDFKKPYVYGKKALWISDFKTGSKLVSDLKPDRNWIKVS